jgi:2TM domain
MKPVNRTADNAESLRRRRRIGKLFSGFLLYIVILAILAGVDAMQSPGHRWVMWPALGLALAFLVGARRTVVTPHFADETNGR